VQKDQGKRMPIRWMAPESFTEYTFKGDVWAYGVCVWELMTRGANPYAMIDTYDLMEYLQAGKRLKKPPYCPDDIYTELMLACWAWNPEQRPTFTDICVNLPQLIKRLERGSTNKQLDEHYQRVSFGGTLSSLHTDNSPTASTASPSHLQTRLRDTSVHYHDETNMNTYTQPRSSTNSVQSQRVSNV